MTSDVLIARTKRAGRLTLNRPNALNALTVEMVRAIHAALAEWEFDDAIELVLIDAASDRAFCAGGDIRAMWDSRKSDDGRAENFLREQYRMDAKLASYRKPLVVLVDGIAMGGGVGLLAHATHRVVTERASIAMPEVGIGFLPDVGTTFILSRVEAGLGTYIALTGCKLSPSDAILCGVADSFMSSARKTDFIRACESEDFGGRAREATDRLVRWYNDPPPPSALALERAWISTVFGASSVEKIMYSLSALASERAREAHATISSRSPTSLKATLLALRTARDLPSVAACLDMEYRIACRLMQGHDFNEGVRAAVVDKDRDPSWRPALLEDVRDADVASFLSPLGEADLGLAA